MYFDLPRLKRCCFCLPLRRGLLAVAYVNILYTLSVVGYAAHELRSRPGARAQLVLRGNVFEVGCVLLLAFYCLDALLYAVLLLGAHKRVRVLLQVFLVYGAGSTVAALLANLCLMRRVRGDEFLLIFFGTVLQCYLLVMVRSEILKLEEEIVPYSVTHSSQAATAAPQADDATQMMEDGPEGGRMEHSITASTEMLYDKLHFDTEVENK